MPTMKTLSSYIKKDDKFKIVKIINNKLIINTVYYQKLKYKNKIIKG